MTRVGNYVDPNEVSGTMSIRPLPSGDCTLDLIGVVLVGSKERVVKVGASVVYTESESSFELSLFAQRFDGQALFLKKVWSKIITIPAGFFGLFEQEIDFEIVDFVDEEPSQIAFAVSAATEGSGIVSIRSREGIDARSFPTASKVITSPDIWTHSFFGQDGYGIYIDLRVPNGISEIIPAPSDSITATFEASSEPVVFGINFRDTLAYVTDPPNTAGWARDLYPTTRNGITFGIVGAYSSYLSRNRNASADPRLAGLTQQINNSAVMTHRVDLVSGANKYSVSIAAGDYSNAKDQYLRIRDGVGGAILLEFSGIASASGRFLDATGVSRTAALWPTTNAPVELTFTADHCIIEVGRGYSGAGGDSSIAHISFAYFPPAPDGFNAEITEVVPATTDSIVAEFIAATGVAGSISETVPAASDFIAAEFSVPEYAGVVTEVVPASVDSLIANFAAPEFSATITELIPAATDAIAGAFAAPVFSAAISETIAPVADAIAALFSLPASPGTITENVPPAIDSISATFSRPVFTAELTEWVPASVDAITANFMVAGYHAAITETVPAANDALSGNFSAPEFSAAIIEFVPSATDSIAATFSAPGVSGAITETLPAATDSIAATFSVPQFTAQIIEFVPAAVDAITARNGDFVYHPSEIRTFRIPAENRRFVIRAENRTFFIPPENRTFKIRS